MAVTNGKAPTSERGTAVATVYNWTGVLPWSQFMDDAEKAPELVWPRSIEWYDMMRNDAQCQGLYLGATAALRRYGWFIDPNQCDPAWVNELAADMNLVVGEAAAHQALQSGAKSAALRSGGRFSWYRHLPMLLRALYYGHFYFEQVGEMIDSPVGLRWQLRKLGPRHPRTITEIKVADDGGLVSITQGYGAAGQPPPEIPVDRLVAYVWDQDPGNWVGRSIFRPMYRNWLVKDRLLRVDAIKHERNGVGMPIVEAPPGATPADIQALDAMAQEYKVGERGGGAVPHQTRLRLVGTEGSIPDTLASIRFHNEEMARSMLMMFMQLGQTETGSRALGQSFIDWFQEQQTYIADWVVGTTVEYLIEDWWGWNVDPAAQRTPRLGYVRDEAGAPQPGDFAGATLPEEVAAALREPRPSRQGRAVRRHHHAALPASGTDLPVSESILPGGGPAEPLLGNYGMTLPNRKLRRKPYSHEVRAGTDFNGQDEDEDKAKKEADEAWDKERDSLIGKMADAAKDKIPDPEDIKDKLPDKDEVVEAATEAATEAAKAAAAEAAISAATGADPGTAAAAAGAAAGEAAFTTIIQRYAKKSANRIQNELLRQGLLRTISIAGAVYFVGPPAWRLAHSYMHGLRAMTAAQGAGWLANWGGMGQVGPEILDAEFREFMYGPRRVETDHTGGMIHQTENRTRTDIYAAVADDLEDDEALRLYASELLDINTCPACAYMDGQELTLPEARRYYGGGGYIECDGGPRCRGTVVAVYEERSYGQARS